MHGLFSIISGRIFDHVVTKNKFIDTSVQKGCIENISGCWEHISSAWNTLKEARMHNKHVTSVWLDIANK